MAIIGTLGTAGLDFTITETDVSVDTGNVTQEHQMPVSVRNLTVDIGDLVYSVSGSVGTTPFDFNVNSVNNQSGSGYETQVIRNNDGDFSNLKMISIVNTHPSNNLLIGSPSANSLFTWNSTSDTLVIPPNTGFAFAYGSAKAVSSNGLLEIVASSADTTFQIFVLGN